MGPEITKLSLCHDSCPISSSPSSRGTKRSKDCRASLAMTEKMGSDPNLPQLPVIARNEAIQGLPRFARNDRKNGI
jgi:hypothetical protein